MEGNRFLILSKICFISFLYALETEPRAHHHRVHNLALYPERHSWCQVQPIRQEISAHDNPECKPLVIDNVVCLGACFSYSIPRSQDDAIIPPYCDACRPTNSSWTTVALNCTKEDTQERYHVLRNVELIGNCSCVDCNEKRNGDIDENIGSGEIDSSELEDATVELEHEDDDIVDFHNLPFGIDLPTLHKLKSVSAELKTIPKATEDLMIKDNKISPDDDKRR